MVMARANFRSMFENVQCDLCDLEVTQTTNHLLECPTLIENCTALYNDEEVHGDDVFSDDIAKQLKATKLFREVLDVKAKLEEESASSH